MPFTPNDPSSAAVSHEFVQVSDTTDLTRHYRYLYCSVAGTLRLKTPEGVTYSPVVPAGYFMGGAARIYATGSGATLNAAATTTIIGFY